MKSGMTGRTAAGALGLCLLTCVSANAGPLPERVEKAAQERIAAGTHQTLVFGVVDADKSEVVAFGKLDDGTAPDGDTVYEIGSITKTFTATLLAQAVLAGRLTLETPVSRLLPDFRIPSRGGREITLGDLATQHSGLPRLPSNLLPRDAANPYADYDAAKLKAFLAGYELPRDPGAAYEYSNLGFGLLGYALTQWKHTTYGAAIHAAVLEPLGMTMTGTDLDDPMRIHLAHGHDLSGAPAKNWDLDALAGAGALRSTANDMLRYLEANMGNGPPPLAAAMTSAQEPRSDMRGPRSDMKEPRSDTSNSMRIGLAWMTTRNGIVWHSGGTGGYRSFVGFTADRRRGVVILSNTAADVDDLGFASLDPDAPLAPTRKVATLPTASLDQYVGTYKLAEGFLLKVSRAGDGLSVQATGQGPIAILPSAPDEFFAGFAGIAISFTHDGQGAVNGLVLHQKGDHVAPKVNAAGAAPERREITLDATTLGEYVGQYKFDFGALLDVALRGDHLEAQLTAQAAFPIFASAKDRFFYKVVDAQLDFERDASGAITGLILHQAGRERRASRMPPPR